MQAAPGMKKMTTALTKVRLSEVASLTVHQVLVSLLHQAVHLQHHQVAQRQADRFKSPSALSSLSKMQCLMRFTLLSKDWGISRSKSTRKLLCKTACWMSSTTRCSARTRRYRKLPGELGTSFGEMAVDSGAVLLS